MSEFKFRCLITRFRYKLGDLGSFQIYLQRGDKVVHKVNFRYQISSKSHETYYFCVFIGFYTHLINISSTEISCTILWYFQYFINFQNFHWDFEQKLRNFNLLNIQNIIIYTIPDGCLGAYNDFQHKNRYQITYGEHLSLNPRLVLQS